MSFNGKYLIKLQTKNQVVLPSKLREDDSDGDLPKSFYLFSEDFIGAGPSKGEKGNASKRIMMYPLAVWNEVVEKMEEKLRAASLKDAGKQIKLLRSSVEKVELDPQYRFTLKQELLQRVGISEKELYFVGNGNKIEIWEKSAFDLYTQPYEASLKQTFKEFADEL